MDIKKIIAIIQKDIKIELRQEFSAASIILFSVTCGYLIYRTFGMDISSQVWNILLWLLVLFAGLNAIVKSFVQEREETYMYYYSLFSALDIIIAKIVYNFIFLAILFGVLMGVFFVLLGNPIVDFTLFFSGAVVGLLGISTIFTFVASVSAASGGNNTIMSVLALPLVIPIVMLMVKITSVSMNLMQDSEIYNDVWIALGIDMIMIGVVLIIFPSMWRS